MHTMKKTSALLGSLLFGAALLTATGQPVHADTTTQTAPQTTNVQTSSQTADSQASQTAAADQTATEQVATSTPAVQQQFTSQINYVKGYGVNLWQLNSDQSVTWTGRRLTAGTQWKTFGYTDLSKSQQRVYNLAAINGFMLNIWSTLVLSKKLLAMQLKAALPTTKAAKPLTLPQLLTAPSA